MDKIYPRVPFTFHLNIHFNIHLKSTSTYTYPTETFSI